MASIKIGSIIVHDTKGMLAVVKKLRVSPMGLGFSCRMLSKNHNQYPPEFFLGEEPKNWRTITDEEYSLWKTLNE